MKAIQFKKTGTFTGNDEEIQALFGGHFCYMGKGRLQDIEMYFERGSQSLPIKFNDWIVDLNGVILVLDGVQYQSLVAEAASTRKQTDDQKQIGQMIHDSVKAVISREQRQGGLLTTESKDNAPDVDSTTIKDCRKRFQVKIDKNSIIAGNKFAEGGYIKPPYIIEMENQIKALSTMVSALDCRLNVLSGGK
ncbi:hypothetical protein [Acinetobacter johnsonii]|jgi:hypothetical protein|uniref:hypothetical protein n=1 Tax=Acinetobacter johnsonii TaxID=40214 RepID=UPI0007B41420|nr:hypothetical protein [Acinetobacter johnsonii]